MRTTLRTALAVLVATATAAAPAAAAPPVTAVPLAGDGTPVPATVPGPALGSPLPARSVAVLPDGALAADDSCARLWRVAAGRVTLLAGAAPSPCAPGAAAPLAGDGLPAVLADLVLPGGLAALPGGALAFADVGHFAVRTVGADGVLRTLAGSGAMGYADGPARAAALGMVGDVAPAAEGGVLLADTTNHRVRLARDGRVTTVAGSGPVWPDEGASAGDGGPAHAARLALPVSVLALRDGSVLAGELGGRVRRIGADGTVSTMLDGLASALDLALDRDGAVLVADGVAGRVVRWKGGVATTFAHVPFVQGLAVTAGGDVVAATGTGLVRLDRPGRDDGRAR